MKRFYTEPHCDFVKISLSDVMILSDPDKEEGPVDGSNTTNTNEGGNGAVLEKKVAYMNNVVHHSVVDHGDLYDPFYTAPSFSFKRPSSDSDTDAESTNDPYSGYSTDTDLSGSDSDIPDDMM